jgi:hypothetical protein
MNTTIPTKLRWYQFRLRTLLIFVTLFCVVLGFWVKGRNRGRAITEIRSCGWIPGPNFGSWNFGLWMYMGLDYSGDVKYAYVSREETLKYLEALPELRRLTIERSGFPGNSATTDEGLVQLEKLKRLEVLRIWNCPVTDAGLVHLRGLNHLTRLELMGTQATDEGVKDLEKVLPNCDIQLSKGFYVPPTH